MATTTAPGGSSTADMRIICESAKQAGGRAEAEEFQLRIGGHARVAQSVNSMRLACSSQSTACCNTSGCNSSRQRQAWIA